jgi:Fur family peroxide stress response transcriptional regulator
MNPKNSETRLASLVEKLRRDGHRITPQRLAILKLFADDERHPSVEQVFERVRQDYPTTSLATVYKTVLLLKGKGEILELGFAGSSSRYDLKRPNPHPHLICVECQRIVDLDIDPFDDLPQALARKYGYQIVNQRDDFIQPGDLYRKVMTEPDRQHLVDNITGHLRNAQERIQLRQTALFYKADPEYGSRVAAGIGLDLEAVQMLAGMSAEERLARTNGSAVSLVSG